jgi:hypothetical protein
VPKDPATETKVAHIYRYVTQCATISEFRVTPGDPVMVTFYRDVPGPGGMSRGTVLVTRLSLDGSLEYLKGLAQTP